MRIIARFWGTKRPKPVGEKRDWCGNQDRKTLRGGGRQADARVEQGKARVVDEERSSCDNAKATEIARHSSSARRESPGTEQYKVKEAVEDECDAEGQIGVYADGDLARVERNSQQIADADDYAITHKLDGGLLGGRSSQGRDDAKHNLEPSAGRRSWYSASRACRYPSARVVRDAQSWGP